jgi:hypothetical protein
MSRPGDRTETASVAPSTAPGATVSTRFPSSPPFRRVELASAKGVDARYEDVPGHGHGSILRWDGIAHHLQALIAALPQETSAR